MELPLTSRAAAEWICLRRKAAKRQDRTVPYHGREGRLPGWRRRTVAAVSLVLRIPSGDGGPAAVVHERAAAVKRWLGGPDAFDLTPPDALHFTIAGAGLLDPYQGRSALERLRPSIEGLARVTEGLWPFAMRARGFDPVANAMLLRGIGGDLQSFAAMKAAIWEADVPLLAGEGDSPYVHPAAALDGKRGLAAHCTAAVFLDDSIEMGRLLAALKNDGARTRPDVAFEASRIELVACLHDGGAIRLLTKPIARFVLGEGLTHTAEPSLESVAW